MASSKKHVCIFNRQCWCGAGPDTPMSEGGQSCAGWPRRSVTYGCLTGEIPKKVAEYARHGIQVEFAKNGEMFVRDPGHQKQIMKLHGDVDLSREITQPKNKTMKERSIRPRPNRKFSLTL